MFRPFHAQASRASGSGYLRFFSDRSYKLPPGTVIPELRPTDTLYAGRFLCRDGHIALINNRWRATRLQKRRARIVEAEVFPPHWRAQKKPNKWEWSRNPPGLALVLAHDAEQNKAEAEQEKRDEREEEAEEKDEDDEEEFDPVESIVCASDTVYVEWAPKRYWQSVRLLEDERSWVSSCCPTHDDFVRAWLHEWDRSLKHNMGEADLRQALERVHRALNKWNVASKSEDAIRDLEALALPPNVPELGVEPPLPTAEPEVKMRDNRS